MLDAAGVLRIFTVRIASDLVGYAIYFARSGHVHYRSTPWAVSDIVLVRREHRNPGVGNGLFEFIERSLAEDGCPRDFARWRSGVTRSCRCCSRRAATRATRSFRSEALMATKVSPRFSPILARGPASAAASISDRFSGVSAACSVWEAVRRPPRPRWREVSISLRYPAPPDSPTRARRGRSAGRRRAPPAAGSWRASGTCRGWPG